MRRAPWVLLAALACGASVAQAIHLKVSLPELSQTADLIFVGTVTGQSTRLSATKTMPVTDVVFGNIEVVHATARSTQRSATTVTLTYAGGRLGETTVNVSDTPRFVDGHRYLVFVLDDGASYFTPVVGGSQGQFEVVADAVTGVPYVMDRERAGRGRDRGQRRDGVGRARERHRERRRDSEPRGRRAAQGLRTACRRARRQLPRQHAGRPRAPPFASPRSSTTCEPRR